MITTTMMTTVIRRDNHNDVKQVALDFGKDQSRIFLYAYMIRKKSHDDMLIQYYRKFFKVVKYEHRIWTTYLYMGKWFFVSIFNEFGGKQYE